MGARTNRCKPTDLVTPEVQERIARLALRGMTGVAIAKEVGIAARTAQNWIRRMDAEHLKRSHEDTALRIARHHAQLDDVIAEAWRSFATSKRAELIKVVDEKGERWEEGPGDPRFLITILGAMDRRAKLLGTDKAPEPPSPFIGNPLREVDLTLEQAAELLAMSGAQLLDLSARSRAELAAAKAANLAEQTGAEP